MAGRKEINLIGKKFGRLTVKHNITKGNNTKWLCKCDCGETVEVFKSNLGRSTFSCGCIKAEEMKKDCVQETRLRNLKWESRKRKHKDSGVKGVTWKKSSKKWVARIGFRGKDIYLGFFDDINDAIAIRKEAEKVYYKPILEKYLK